MFKSISKNLCKTTKVNVILFSEILLNDADAFKKKCLYVTHNHHILYL